jgi:hypothetical protein
MIASSFPKHPGSVVKTGATTEQDIIFDSAAKAFLRKQEASRGAEEDVREIDRVELI